MILVGQSFKIHVPSRHLHGQRDLTPTPTVVTMPPRIPISRVARCCSASIGRSNPPTGTAATPLVSLLAALSIHQPRLQPLLSQSRNASILSDLRDNKGAYNKRIRKGRGASSGYGKTSGRGHKGQGQHGKVKPWFQGGQTPLIFKHGQLGFINQYDAFFSHSIIHFANFTLNGTSRPEQTVVLT